MFPLPSERLFVDQLAQEWDIVLTLQQQTLFRKYAMLLQQWNEKMNLTTIVATEEVYEKHFFDSITVLDVLPLLSKERLLDIGAGAGFPSLVLKIVRPELQVTIIEATQKRVAFMRHVCEQLGWDDVVIVHGRAEQLGQEVVYREQFDVVVARAVAAMEVLAEWCLPFVRVGGYFIALKGMDPEWEQAHRHISRCGGGTISVQKRQLPWCSANRTVVKVDKTTRTPKKYPRKTNPKKTKATIVPRGTTQRDEPTNPVLHRRDEPS